MDDAYVKAFAAGWEAAVDWMAMNWPDFMTGEEGPVEISKAALEDYVKVLKEF